MTGTGIRLSGLALKGVVALDGHAGLLLAMQLGMFLFVLFVSLLPLIRGEYAESTKIRVIFSVSVVLTLFAFRFPFFACPELNPDESLEIAAANTLLRDPVFWRSVDLGTHGPLSPLPLLLPTLFHLEIDYASARMIGLLMLDAGVLLLFAFTRKVVSGKAAMLGVLPFIAFFCFADYMDFIAYNAEHPVILFALLALYFIGNILHGGREARLRDVVLAGLVIGCFPYVKIQSLPIMLSLALFGMIACHVGSTGGEKRNQLYFLCSCAAGTAVVWIYLVSFGLMKDFRIRYLSGQFNYATVNTSFRDKFMIFLSPVVKSAGPIWAYAIGLILISAAIVTMVVVARSCHAHRQTSKITGLNGIVLFNSLTLLSASMIAVFVPGRAFAHYYLLIVFAACVAGCNMFCISYGCLRGGRAKYICIVAFAVAGMLPGMLIKVINKPYHFDVGRLVHDIAQGRYFAKYDDGYDISDDQAISDEIMKYASPGEKMVVWGWTNKYHVRTGLIIGCRTLPCAVISNVFGNHAYYLDSFVDELAHSKAPVFLDAVAPKQFVFRDKAKHGFDRFPAIAARVTADYSCVRDIGGVRIYVSKQRLKEIEGRSGHAAASRDVLWSRGGTSPGKQFETGPVAGRNDSRHRAV